MPVPWEALIPFGLASRLGLMVTMFGITGTLTNLTFRGQNQGKPPRYGLERWDEMMIARDYRLTGHNRGQTVRFTEFLSFRLDSHVHNLQSDPVIRSREPESK
ncbi:Small secreted protein [Mycena venus]|uniref:NADH dehydrogenase [ubiquinone] 1 alpha subcomplex subunit 1 n=1 Tax=Mycena venus TaxID=2733690 RepID=A0A8H7CVX9_9AGAR|nr:Small secreted protein [Mycena venus]